MRLWPLLLRADSLPVFEGVVACLLTAMSLLALLGLRYPVKLLPVLLFESAWKLILLAVVALPKAAAGDLDAAAQEVLVACSLVVVILAVTPWRYVWRQYVRATWTGGDDRDRTWTGDPARRVRRQPRDRLSRWADGQQARRGQLAANG